MVCAFFYGVLKSPFFPLRPLDLPPDPLARGFLHGVLEKRIWSPHFVPGRTSFFFSPDIEENAKVQFPMSWPDIILFSSFFQKAHSRNTSPLTSSLSSSQYTLKPLERERLTGLKCRVGPPRGPVFFFLTPIYPLSKGASFHLHLFGRSSRYLPRVCFYGKPFPPFPFFSGY